MAVFSLVSIMNIQPLSSRQGDLMTFDHRFCPACRIIDNKVVKSPPMPPPYAWMGGEVGHYFDRCIITRSDAYISIINWQFLCPRSTTMIQPITLPLAYAHGVKIVNSVNSLVHNSQGCTSLHNAKILIV